MLKLLALIVIFVLFIRSIGFLLRFLLGGGMMGRASKEFREGRQGSGGGGRRRSNGDVNIDYVPNEKGKKKKGFKGGDYVDYEEVS